MSESGTSPGGLERATRFFRNRFSRGNALGLQLTLGIVVMLLGGWCFSELAEHLGPSTAQVALDQRVTTWFHAHAQPQLTTLARALTFCGSVGFVSAVSICAAVYFALHRAWNRLLLFAMTMLGGTVLNIALKHFFHRQRPVLENPLVTLSSFGFPSGHTMGSTLLYGLLALLIARRAARTWQRIGVLALAALVIGTIGVTRIYLGAHYLSDVVAAVAIGAAWLSFCWALMNVFGYRRHR